MKRLITNYRSKRFNLMVQNFSKKTSGSLKLYLFGIIYLTIQKTQKTFFMKKTWGFFLALGIVAITIFTGCKKSDSDPTHIDENTQLAIHSDDEARFSDAVDNVNNDANDAIESSAAFAGRGTEVATDICNATVTLDSTVTDRRLTITYNGSNCLGNHTRTGTVTLTMPLAQHFSDTGAMVTVTWANLKITRISDGKSITINGVHTITNVTGGRLINLASLQTIIHDINSAGMSVTFDNGTSRTWMVARRRTFTYASGINISITGTHTDGTTTNVSEWGTTRFGNPFVTAITQPLVISQSCDFRLVSGQVAHHRLVADVVVTFGLDSSGMPATCPGLGNPYYYKLVWTGANGVQQTVIAPYN